MSKIKPWTETDEKLLSGKLSDEVLAKAMGRSVDSVERKRRRLGIEPVKPVAQVAANEEPSYEAEREESSRELWRRKFGTLQKKYEKALHENNVVEALVQDIKDVAPVSYSPAPPIHVLRQPSDSTPQSAFLLFTDTHVGKVVTREQTLGFGEYNFQIFLARLKYLEESVESILKNHCSMVIDELVVAMLGDMLDGALGHGVEAGQHTTLFSQFYLAGHAIAQFFRKLATLVPKIRIQTAVGNHTRWQNQKRMPTENRFSNLDMFLYALVEALTADITNIEWNMNMQPFTIFEVQGWVFHGSHGDHLRGGDKALGIPNHAVGRNISVTTQLFNKHGQTAPHYYVCGHLHREIQLPHATGSFIINGGFPGLDNYGLMESFNPVDPTQRFFFIHPKYGKTAEYSLSLKWAEVSEQEPYTMPTQFPVAA